MVKIATIVVLTNNATKNIELYVLSFTATAFFLVLAGFVVYFIVIYQKKQIQNKLERDNLQYQFSQEMLKAQIEVQEQTLEYISREIHDNITQVLSFVKLNLAMATDSAEGETKTAINESRELVAQSISDLRDLSKSLSFEHITQLGLVKTIEIETERINKTGIINTTLTIEGDPFSIGEQQELVLFRIYQEALNNTLKHAGAKHFNIRLQYHPDLFNLTLEDDGAGFLMNSSDNKSGSGLRNMENRAAIIGAKASIKSSPGEGCSIAITLDPLKLRSYANGPHPDRFG